MRKRRKRSLRIPWTPILALSLLANVVAGLYTSQLCSLRRVRVVGAPEHEQARLESFLRELEGKPALSVLPEHVETFALSNPAVAAAQFVRNPFGSASLTLRYHEPAARLTEPPGWFLSKAGTWFAGPETSLTLPRVTLPEDTRILLLSAAGAAPYRRVAEIAKRVSAHEWAATTEIRVEPAGSVCLYTGLTARIELGSGENLSEKFATLDRLLQDRADLLSQVKLLNLSAPSRPVIAGPIPPPAEVRP